MWFKQAKNNVHDELKKTVSKIEQDNSGHNFSLLRSARLYSNEECDALSVAAYAVQNARNATPLRQNRINLNVIQSCVDTITSKISKNKIRPLFVTSKGSWKAQRKAQQLNKFIAGLFYQSDVHSVVSMVFRDACIYGTGIVKVLTNEDGEVVVERVLPDEVMVDYADGYYGKPKTLYQRKFVSKDALAAQFPEQAMKIQSCASAGVFSRISTDTVIVTEAWHLPSSKKATDGRHVICLENVTLVDEEWSDELPFAFIHFTRPDRGFFGKGLCSILQGVQIEINKILMHISKVMELVDIPRIFLPQDSKINPAHILSTKIGTIIPTQGGVPVIQTPNAVSGDYWRQLENLYNKAFEIAGISQLSAQSSKPAGLDSGKALREFSDIETERFASIANSYQEFHLQIARLCIKEVVRQAEKEGDFVVKSFGRKDGLEEISWKDIDLDESAYVMQCFPTSALPASPSGRLQAISEMMTAGLIDSDTGAELLDFPDLEAATELKNAPTRLIRKVIERMLDTGEYFQPEPFWNLPKCIELATLYYNDLRLKDSEESDLEMLRQFIEECQSLMPAPEPQAALPQ